MVKRKTPAIKMSPELEQVEWMLFECANALRRTPAVKAAGYRSYWPQYDDEENCEVDLAELAKRLLPICTESEMDARLFALSTLETGDRKAVWLRVGTGRLMPWRKMAKKLGGSHEGCRQHVLAVLKTLSKIKPFTKSG